nr:hypothetical protein [uncultured Flavobacterium sp.]
MKKIILSATLAFALLATSNTFAQQGFGTNQPDKSAAVDIVSSKRGLLIPRVALTATDNNGPITAPANSLFVYNTATDGTGATAVTPGFYYWERTNTSDAGAWQGKWVRFTTAVNEKDVVVKAAENGNITIPEATYVDGVKTYNVSVKGGTEGQVLVSNASGGTVWVNPNDFVFDELVAGNAIGISKNAQGKIEIKFNGNLTEDTTIATGNNNLAITGLDEVTTDALTADDKIVIMGADGVLKITSRAALFDAKDLTLGDGLAFEQGNGQGAVLQPTKIEIQDFSVKAEKLNAKDETAGHVATVNADGTVTYQAITPGSLTDKKTLTGQGITVNGNPSVADALLADVTLAIADGAITNAKLAPKSVSPDKMTSFTTDNGTQTPATAGQVPVADGAGNVTYQAITPGSLTDKKTLTTDGKIYIVGGTNEGKTLADAVLVQTELKIAAESLTSEDIKNGTIQAIDMKSEGNSKVMVTDASGNVTWIDQSALGNKDSYTGVGAITIAENGTSANGLNYNVSVATASGTTLGVVKEAATDATVNITDGVLGINLSNTKLSGDVTGSLDATKVEAIQGTAVSETDPLNNQVLKFDETVGKWVPSQLSGTDITGQKLSSSTITVSETNNAALLQDLNIEITPANKAGLVLTTIKKADGSLTTSWEKPTASYSTTNVDIAGNTNYSPYISEIILKVTLANADQTVTFPAATSENEGQTISIKIVNANENHTGYLNVLNTYGSMPYQGWIVKSNGSEWIIVGRN